MKNEPSTARQRPRSWLSGLGRPFDSLTVRNYRVYWLGSIFLHGAAQMTQLARPWLAYELSGSAVALGLTVAANSLPSLLLSPLAGALADRYSMRRILIVTAALMGLLALLTAGGAWSGWIRWWHVALLGLAQGTVMSFMGPARLAAIGQMVDARRLLNAISLNTVSLNVGRIIAPATVGVIIGAMGVEIGYALIGGMYGVGIAFLFLLPSLRIGATGRRRSIVGDIGDGFRYVGQDRTILRLLGVGFVATIFGQPIQHLLPLFQPVLDIGPEGLGLLFSFMGMGAFAGSLTAASLGDYHRKGLLLVIYVLILGASVVSFSASGWYLLSLALMVPLGFGHSGRNVVYETVLQSYAPEHLRGRVLAMRNMQSGLLPVAVLPLSALSQAFGAPLALGVSGSIVLVYALWELLFANTVRRLE